MEPTLTADVIYTLVLKLKGDGLNDAEIKKALVNSVLVEQQLLQTFNKEAIFLTKKHHSHFEKRTLLYFLFCVGAICLLLLPFLSEKTANVTFLTIAFGVSTFLVFKLRTLFS